MNKNKDDNIIERPILYNIEIEQAILGAIIDNNEMLNKLNELNFKEEYFYLPIHQKIYNHIKDAIIKNNIIANNMTLKNFFDNEEIIKQNGGSTYINTLLYKGVGVIGINDYVKILEDFYIKRNLINIANNIVDDVYKNVNNIDSKSIIDDTEVKILKLNESKSTQNYTFSISEGLSQVSKVADDFITNSNDPNYLTGVSSGFISIDEYLQGFQSSSLNILAGGTSMGKTTLALNFAVGSAEYFKKCYEEKRDKSLKKVVYYSIEMPVIHLCAKLMSKIIRVSSEDILKGQKGLEDEYAKAFTYLSNLPIIIDETPGMTIANFKTKIRRLFNKEDGNIGIIYVDHLGLLRGIEKKSQLSQVQQISEIAWELKQIAREFKIPVVALSQLNRDSTKIEEKVESFSPPLIPQLHHLKDSSSIEQDADTVMVLHRPCYYIARKSPSKENTALYEKWQKSLSKYKINKFYEKAHVGILKNRLGRITEDPIELYYCGKNSEFISPEAYEKYDKEKKIEELKELNNKM